MKRKGSNHVKLNSGSEAKVGTREGLGPLVSPEKRGEKFDRVETLFESTRARPVVDCDVQMSGTIEKDGLR